jgi:hypothetical protein
MRTTKHSFFNNLYTADTIWFLHLIRKNKIIFFLLSLLFFGIFTNTYYSYFRYYESQVVLGLTNTDYSSLLNTSAGTSALETPVLEIKKIHKILYSKEMVEHLNKRFKLSLHYNLDNNDPYLQAKLFARVKENILLRRGNYDDMIIKVKDINNPVFCYDVLNEVVAKLEAESNRKMAEELKSKTEIFTEYTTEYFVSNADLTANLNRALESIENNSRPDDKKEKVYTEILKLTGSIDRNVNNMQSLGALYKLAYMNSIKNNYPKIEIIQPAWPDDNANPVSPWLLYPAGIFLSFMLTSILLYFVIMIKSDTARLKNPTNPIPLYYSRKRMRENISGKKVMQTEKFPVANTE